MGVIGFVVFLRQLAAERGAIPDANATEPAPPPADAS
jgi:hypothetical protein